eukprot:466471-Amphidinium_carterae.1
MQVVFDSHHCAIGQALWARRLARESGSRSSCQSVAMAILEEVNLVGPWGKSTLDKLVAASFRVVVESLQSTTE